MTIGRAVTLLAGTMILVSLLLSQLYSPYWLLLTAFVGLNLVQSSFTGFCPAAMIFKLMGVKPGGAFPRRFAPDVRREAPASPTPGFFLSAVRPDCRAPW